MWQYSELYHHGIKGQKWGVRRYQNEDGSLTNAGKKRYGYDDMEALTKTRTGFGATLKADKAAYKRAQMVSKYDDKGNKLNAYARGSKMYDIRSDVYKEAAKKMEEQGRLKTAINMEATAKNNQALAKASKSIASGKTAVKRFGKALFKSGPTHAYTSAGRKYLVQRESLLNEMTFGLYSVAADAAYKRKYTAEERLSNLRNN